jgi:polar amino acid transport system permease protein
MIMTTLKFIELLKGAGLTLELTILAVFCGLILGLILALCRISRSKVLNGISWFYIWIFRGTPLLLQIFVIYYALPSIKINLAQFPSAIIALGLNSGAYLAEIIRAAIQSIDKGQMEAAKALGMSYYQAMFKVIIPQSYRRLIPPVGNEVIMLLKDSSLVSAVAMSDLLRNAKVMSSADGNIIYYVVAAAFYLLFTSIFTVLFQKLEAKYSVYE